MKRRRYLISRRTQGRFMLQFAAVSAAGGLLAAVAFNTLAHRRLDSLLYGMLLPSGSTGPILVEQMLLPMLFAVCFSVAALVFTMGRLFRRVNGPLVKLAADIRRIGRGNLAGRVQLRRGDEFQEFADELNAMNGALRKRFIEIQEEVAQLAALSAAADRGEVDRLQLHTRLSRRAERLSEQVQGFTR